jgi:hypothetical protein
MKGFLLTAAIFPWDFFTVPKTAGSLSSLFLHSMDEERAAALLQYATNSTYPAHWTKKTHASQKRQVRRDITCNSFSIVNGTLMKNLPNGEKRKVITVNEVDAVLQQYHDNPLFGGHRGVAKTVFNVTSWYWWPTVRQDVRFKVAGCEKCQTNKPTVMNVEMIPIISTRKNHRWQIDFKGPLGGENDVIDTVEITKKWCYILFCIDHFDKFLWAKSFETKNPGPLVEYLSYLFNTIANPDLLQSDNGGEFNNEVVDSLLEQFVYEDGEPKIKQVRGRAYHPESNGCCERVNSTIMAKWDFKVDETNRELTMKRLESELQIRIACYNNTGTLFTKQLCLCSVHSTTGFTPNFIRFGTKNKSGLMKSTDIHLFQEPERTIVQQAEAAEATRQLAAARLKKKADLMKRKHDTNNPIESFTVGEKVWVWQVSPKNKYKKVKSSKHLAGIIFAQNMNFKLFIIFVLETTTESNGWNKDTSQKTLRIPLVPKSGITKI